MAIHFDIVNDTKYSDFLLSISLCIKCPNFILLWPKKAAVNFILRNECQLGLNISTSCRGNENLFLTLREAKDQHSKNKPSKALCSAWQHLV